MAKKEKTAISPQRSENYAAWYQEVVSAADLAEVSPVRGCMVIKPWGYALWENMKAQLDSMFKATGHSNAYFPLFIPLSFIEKEAEHVEGFAKECAVVTHHRLEEGPEGRLVPAGRLQEPLIVRPTSETIIGAAYSKWVESYRDLPILINQWANVVRWEMRTRLFLRTSEFLWQEGHTAHETAEEAWEETYRILDIYKKFAQDYMAVPVFTGKKTEAERFPGAVESVCIEAMMQDRKALQAGTSHFLGQNFAKASEIMFQSRQGEREYAWTTSWGVSTRLVGGMIMVHGDDNGAVIPPRLAPSHVVILPIVRSDKEKTAVFSCCGEVAKRLEEQKYDGKPVRVEVDTREMNAGEKGWFWVKRGIPVRVEIGPRDIQKNAVFVGRRDKGPKDKYSQDREEFVSSVPGLLQEIQESLGLRAERFRREHTHEIEDWAAMQEFFTPKNKEAPEMHGGFAGAHWCGSAACEEKLGKELSVSIRCVPFNREEGPAGKCVVCGSRSKGKVVFAKAY